MRVLYFFCATQRTGASWLADLMHNSGAGKPLEHFTHKGTPEYPALDFFIDKMLRADGNDGQHIGCKLALSQLDHWRNIIPGWQGLTTWQQIQAIVDATRARVGALEVRYIYIYRLDFLAQALSGLRAEQTGVWHWKVEVDNHPRPQVTACNPGINHYIERYYHNHQRWIALLNSHTDCYLPVVYEQARQYTVEVMRMIFNHISFGGQPVISGPTRKQIATEQDRAVGRQWYTEHYPGTV